MNIESNNNVKIILKPSNAKLVVVEFKSKVRHSLS